MIPAILAVSILCGLGAVHLYWAGGGRIGKDAAVPSLKGKPVLFPGPLMTAMVGAALFGLAAFVTATAIGSPWPGLETPLRIGTGLIALIFLARAIGDFRYVGFFKTIRAGTFARRDTYAFSPLCLLLAGLIGAVASI